MERKLYFELHRQFNEERPNLMPLYRILFDELSMMAVLHAGTLMSVAEVAEAHRIGSSTASRRLARLAEADFVALFKLPQDKRSTHCCLTPFGQQSLMAFVREFHANFPKSSCFLRECPRPEDLLGVLAAMGRVPMPADNLILFCYTMRRCDSMSVRDIVYLTGLQEATVSMALRRMEYDGTMLPVQVERYGRTRPHGRLEGRRISRDGKRVGAELLQLVAEL